MHKGYELAYQLARDELRSVADLDELCQRSGASYRRADSETIITVSYLNRPYQVTVPGVAIALEDSEEEVPLVDKILILHYLLQAKGTPVSNELIGYKHVPGGTVYFRTFSQRAIKPVVRHFGEDPGRLPGAAESLGGRKVDFGDVAVTIDAFPRVPITFVLWRGDEEFPPEGNILFDSTICDYLTTDDVNSVCGIIASKLIRISKAARSSS